MNFFIQTWLIYLSATVALSAADGHHGHGYAAPTVNSYGAPTASYGAPAPAYGAPTAGYGAPAAVNYHYHAPAPAPVYKPHYQPYQHQAAPAYNPYHQGKQQYAGSYGYGGEDPYIHLHKEELVKSALLLGAGVVKGVAITTLFNALTDANTGKKRRR